VNVARGEDCALSGIGKALKIWGGAPGSCTDFSLDVRRKRKCSGYRGLWRVTLAGAKGELRDPRGRFLRSGPLGGLPMRSEQHQVVHVGAAAVAAMHQVVRANPQM
jgi:hypothetical protein